MSFPASNKGTVRPFPGPLPAQPQSVLAIDDSPELLKLIATMLRRNGYKIDVASNAEEALSTLRTKRFDLILVDLHLFGINGLEFTRRVRAVYGRGTPIIAMTGTSEIGLDARAAASGCDGFIPKPFDVATLSLRIGQFLDGAMPASYERPPEMPAEGDVWLNGPEMALARRSFLANALAECRLALGSLDFTFDQENTLRVLRRWLGAAGLLGCRDLAAKTMEVIETVERGPSDMAPIRRQFKALLTDFEIVTAAKNRPVPDSLTQGLRGSNVALLGFIGSESDRICRAMQQGGARPRLFTGVESRELEAVSDCVLAIINVHSETLNSPWLFSALDSAMPVVLTGERQHLLALPLDVLTRANEFLIDGWQPEEGVMRVSLALSRLNRGGQESTPAAQVTPPTRLEPATAKETPRKTGRATVLIAEDDPQLQRLIKTVLENHGMQCLVAWDGVEAMRLVTQHAPQAMLLDINMPRMDGFQVLAEIRRTRAAVRIILLTGRQQERDIVRSFALGADDFIAKPFNPAELLVRLKKLL